MAAIIVGISILVCWFVIKGTWAALDYFDKNVWRK